MTYVEWSDAHNQKILVPFTTIANPQDALAFADSIATSPDKGGQFTSISAAIAFGASLLKQASGRALRRVIDISGDGPNNDGELVISARDDAIAEGITINGLPIQIKPAPWDFPGYDVYLHGSKRAWDVDRLDRYFAHRVIGGPGAFVQPANTVADFTEAVTSKIIREVAGKNSVDLLAQKRGSIFPATAREASFAAWKTSCEA